MKGRAFGSFSQASPESLFRAAAPVLYASPLWLAFPHAALQAPSVGDPTLLAASLLGFMFLLALARVASPRHFAMQSRSAGIELLGLLAAGGALAAARADFGMLLPAAIMAGIAFPLMFRTRSAGFLIALGAAATFALGRVAGLSHASAFMFSAALVCGGVASILLRSAHAAHAAAVRQAHMNDRRFNALARATRNVFMIADAGYRIKYANPALQEVIGYTREEIERDNVWPAIHPDDTEAHQEKLRYLRDKPHSKVFSHHRSRHRNGHWVWLETRGYNMLHDPAIDGLVFSIEDVTARKEAEQKLEAEHALLRAVLDHNPAMIYAKDADGHFTVSNASFQRQFGCTSEEELRGKTVHDVISAQLAAPQQRHAARIANALHAQDLEVIRSATPQTDLETQGFWEGDERRWFRSNKFPLRDANGSVIGMIGITRDITERKEYELRLEHQALHDALTGLPNRRYLLQKISEQIAHAKTLPVRAAVLFCDLDFFKSINDTHGHEAGDKCLVELARRVRMNLPETDFVCRYGGDEFVVLTQTPAQEAAAKAQRLIMALSEPLIVGGDVIVKIQASIGIAQLRPSHKSASDLIRDADAAMYQAKERGRSRIETFSPILQHHATKRAQMDVALRFALERNELSLCYQPKVSLTDGAVLGFELLMRWNSLQYGEIPPSEFIPVAERSGLIVPIGLWALEQACWQLQRWQSDSSDRAHLSMAVNVSMKQLTQPGFLADVADILERTGIAATSLELEVTETSAMANPSQTVDTMAALKTLGVRLALDDFGTGYSSLAYLQKLPIDVLKIDKTFVNTLGEQQSDDAIVRMILALAKALHLDIVAEGVETIEQVRELQALGCMIGQGHYFSPPINQYKAEDFLLAKRQFLEA